MKELESYYLTNLPESLKFKRLKELSHKWGNAVDFVTKFKLYATQLKLPEIFQVELFEDKVHPMIKKKFLNLEPERRTIENYSKMLIAYDNEKERHWDLENHKRKNNYSNLHQHKKFKPWNKNNNSKNKGNNNNNNNNNMNYKSNNSNYL